MLDLSSFFHICSFPAGALTRKASSEQLPISEASSELGSLKLEHARPICDVEESFHGPFDVVVTDITHQRVLHALIQVSRHPFLHCHDIAVAKQNFAHRVG